MLLTTQLTNFIIYHLLQARLPFIVFFHCWRLEEYDNKDVIGSRNLLESLAANNLIYTQFVNLSNLNLMEDYEYLYMLHHKPTLAVYIDLNCMESKAFLNSSSRRRLYNQNYHWIIHDGYANMSNFHQQFTQANISVDADVSYIQSQEVGNTTNIAYILYDVYNLGSHIGGQLNITIDREIHCNLSTCKHVHYLSDLYLRSKYGNREKLTGVNWRVFVVVTQRPLTLPRKDLLDYLESKNNTQIDNFARFGFQLLRVLEDMLACNFVITFQRVWSVTKTGGGAIGALVNESADFISTAFLPTQGRVKSLSFIVETGAFHQVCIFRTPRNAGIRGDVFIKPFAGKVWLIFGCVLTLAGILLWFTFFVESRTSMLVKHLKFVPSLLSTLLIAFGAASIQSSSLVPSSTGGRLALFVLLLCSFIMYNYYTSVVVSSLLSSPVKSNIKSLTQLADSSLEVGLEPLPFTKSYLNYSKLPEVRHFIKRKIEGRDVNRVWLSADEGVRRVRDNPGYVYIFEASAGYVLVENYYRPHEICDLNEVMLRPEKALITGIHRNSTYKELVRLRQLRMLETGVYKKHRDYWVRSKLTCFGNSLVINVGMEYVAPLFFMLLCAYILVLFILILEIAWKRYEPKLKEALLVRRDYVINI